MGATRLTLLLDPETDFSSNDFEVSFDGTTLDLLTQGDRWIYDISAFAGATGELKFISFSNSVQVGFPIIDDIQFVPEPSGWFWTAAVFLFFVGSNRNGSRSFGGERRVSHKTY
jgi:hypothetical protein